MAEAKQATGLRGVAAGSTAICTVGAGGDSLRYRGYDVEDLAAHAEFEEVAFLLLYGKLPNRAELAAYQQRLRYGGIRGDEREHRSHHRLDHAGALGHAANHDLGVVDAVCKPPSVPDHDASHRLFRKRIGGHDRARRGCTLIASQRLEGGRQASPDLLDRERDANHAG